MALALLGATVFALEFMRNGATLNPFEAVFGGVGHALDRATGVAFRQTPFSF
jgi:hypothetical protein